MRERSPASQRRYAAEWLHTTLPLSKLASIGGANVTPSAILRGLVTAINWFQPPPMPTTYVASRREAVLAALRAFDAARVPVEPALRERLSHSQATSRIR